MVIYILFLQGWKSTSGSEYELQGWSWLLLEPWVDVRRGIWQHNQALQFWQFRWCAMQWRCGCGRSWTNWWLQHLCSNLCWRGQRSILPQWLRKSTIHNVSLHIFGSIYNIFHISQLPGYDPCNDYYTYSYLNDPAVQKAFHARMTNWSACT